MKFKTLGIGDKIRCECKMTGLLTLLVIIGYKTRSSTAEFRDVDL